MCSLFSLQVHMPIPSTGFPWPYAKTATYQRSPKYIAVNDSDKTRQNAKAEFENPVLSTWLFSSQPIDEFQQRTDCILKQKQELKRCTGKINAKNLFGTECNGVACLQFLRAPKDIIGTKMFNFRGATVFCFGCRFSKHKLTRYAKHLG